MFSSYPSTDYYDESNRQEARDREQANNDYKINLKAEVEINLLHEKMDYIINNQLENLVKIQNIQIELLGELQEQLAATSEKRVYRRGRDRTV